mmetsp:Transcript_6638/g.16206  ORF Transcript_6638/g.16206 Transcript_6638/m.16206 type:complete len:295 (+) Transcript_6638:394-1278(+)
MFGFFKRKGSQKDTQSRDEDRKTKGKNNAVGGKDAADVSAERKGKPQVDQRISAPKLPKNPHTDKKNSDPAKCPIMKAKLEGKKWPTPRIKRTIPLARRGFTHQTSKDQADVLKDIGGGDRIRSLCTRFYEKAFDDSVLSTFMFEDDGAEAHGKRLGDWIVEKMGGEGKPWTDSGRFGLRSESHSKAWYSKKREPEKVGRRFKLDDCRIWMRLMFWAAREEGLAEHKPFFNWYQEFIGHFINVYERSAPPYTTESAEWSANEKNTKKYVADGREMRDVIGFHVAPQQDPYSFFS